MEMGIHRLLYNYYKLHTSQVEGGGGGGGIFEEPVLLCRILKKECKWVISTNF